MDNQKIIFRFAREEDFTDIARLHFIDGIITDSGSFNFSYEKIRLLHKAGAEIIVAQDKNRLAGFIIFIKNVNSAKKTFLLHGYIFRYFFRFITGYYGFNRELLRKIFSILRANLNPARIISCKKDNLPKSKIISVIVEKNDRRKGVGSKLVKLCCDCLLGDAIDSLHLTVQQNNLVAIGMYKKLGFSVIGNCYETTGASFIMSKNLSVR